MPLQKQMENVIQYLSSWKTENAKLLTAIPLNVPAPGLLATFPASPMLSTHLVGLELFCLELSLDVLDLFQFNTTLLLLISLRNTTHNTRNGEHNSNRRNNETRLPYKSLCVGSNPKRKNYQEECVALRSFEAIHVLRQRVWSLSLPGMQTCGGISPCHLRDRNV